MDEQQNSAENVDGGPVPGAAVPPYSEYPPPAYQYPGYGYPPPGYQYPGYGYPPPPAAKPNEPAWGYVAIALGALAFLVGPVLSIPAIITGMVGKRENIKKGFSTVKPRIGFWLGVASLAMYAVFIGLFILFVLFMESTTPSPKVVTAVKNASTAANSYYMQNETYGNITVSDLARYGYVPQPGVTVNLHPDGGSHLCVDATTQPGNETHSNTAHIWLTNGENLSQTGNTWDTGECSCATPNSEPAPPVRISAPENLLHIK